MTTTSDLNREIDTVEAVAAAMTDEGFALSRVGLFLIGESIREGAKQLLSSARRLREIASDASTEAVRNAERSASAVFAAVLTGMDVGRKGG